MKHRLLLLAALSGSLLFAACDSKEKRTDGTAGEVVSDMDNAAADGGVESEAVVIDNNAGPTVAADADTAAAAADTTQR